VPIYDFICECGENKEAIVNTETRELPCHCGKQMKRKMALPGFIWMKGQGFPSRKKWMDNWTPESGKFSTGSMHGERY
jgi:putative FmdB family regulatory protein